ncbi:MAG: HAD family hydrolase [Halanaerobium sp.]|nr:HAD family hydrolase [Halanaerobium sp.]
MVMDIDGTLVTGQKYIPKRMAGVIRHLRDKGILVTIATGRVLASTRHLARKLAIDLPVICNDGVQIHDWQEGRDIYFDPISPPIAAKAFSIIRKYPVRMQLFLQDKKLYYGIKYRPRMLKHYLRVTGLNPRSLWNHLRDFYFIPHQVMPATASSLGEYLQEQGPAKITFNARDNDREEIIVRLEEEIAGGLSFTSGVAGWLDILKEGNSKWSAIKQLAEMYNIREEEIITAGDNYNDLEMLKYAGLGIAMETAPAAVKEIADVVVPAPEEDGLAEYLESLLLI